MFHENNINLEAFAKKKTKGNISRKITRFLTKGYFLDVKVIEDCVRQNIGEITFEVLKF
jgi:TAG lipase/lysophosphatidylethanolamine acyltransferase